MTTQLKHLIPYLSVFTALFLFEAQVSAQPFAENPFIEIGKTVIRIELETSYIVTTPSRKTPRTRKLSIYGTVVSPTGLMVVSLGQIEPPAPPVISGESGGLTVGDVEFKNVKLYYPGDSEVAGRLVHKVTEADLAFFAPEQIHSSSLLFPSIASIESIQPSHSAEFFELSHAPVGPRAIPTVRRIAVIGFDKDPLSVILVDDATPGAPTIDRHGRLLGIAITPSVGHGVIRHGRLLPASDLKKHVKDATERSPEKRP